MLDARPMSTGRAAMVTGSPVHTHRVARVWQAQGHKNGIKRKVVRPLDRRLRLDQSRGLVGG
jgi:hypothetical protein